MQQVLEVVDFAGNLSKALDSVLNGKPISEENIESYLDTAINTIKTQFVDEKEFDFNQIITRSIFQENVKTIVLKKTFRRKDLFFKLGVYKHKIYNDDIIFHNIL